MYQFKRTNSTVQYRRTTTETVTVVPFPKCHPLPTARSTMACVTLEMSLEMFQFCSSFYSYHTCQRRIESKSCNFQCSNPLSVFTVHHFFHRLESWGGKCCIASHCFLPSPPNPRTDFCFLLQSQIPQLQHVFASSVRFVRDILAMLIHVRLSP